LVISRKDKQRLEPFHRREGDLIRRSVQSVTLPAGTPLRLYDIAYRAAYGLQGSLMRNCAPLAPYSRHIWLEPYAVPRT